MSYEPKWYIVRYKIDDKKDQKFIQAEDAYEAISLLRVDFPDADIDGVYVEVYLDDEDDDEDDEEEYDE